MGPLTAKQHVVTDPKVCGGKPVVHGTRIRVWDIHVWHDLRGQSPEEIVANFPQLSVADVHAALAYFLDHREAIERQMSEVESHVNSVAAAQKPTRFSQLRDQLLARMDVPDDSIPPG